MRPAPIQFAPDSFRSSDALTGAALAAAIEATPEIRPHLIEGFILQHSVNIVSSPTGHGKSCLILMMATQGSVGMPVFGDLAVPRPLSTYIFCPERSGEELRERLRKIKAVIPYDLNRITIDEGMVGTTDVTSEICIQSIFRAIDRNAPHGVDIFVIDGLYGMTRKPLSNEETANVILRFNARLIKEFGCAIYYNHHWAKNKYDSGGTILPPNPFGSVFLYAHATGTFLFNRLPTENLSTMKLDKDTVNSLIREFTFSFDPETFTMESIGQSTGKAQHEKLRRFINACHQTGKEFTYADLLKQCDLRIDTIKRHVSPWVKENKLNNLTTNGNKALFKVLSPV